MKRPFAAAAVLVLTLGVAPPAARAPRPPVPLWDLFAAEERLGALSPAIRASALDDLGLPDPARAPAAVPEPAALLLAAGGLAGLAAGRRRRLGPA